VARQSTLRDPKTIELLKLDPLNGYFRSLFPRVPLAVPFWNRETYRSVLRCIVSGQVVRGTDLVALRSQLFDDLGVEDGMLCGSGSLALELGLRACHLRQGDEVIIPSFCCSGVVAPILAVGATPVLADVGSELNLTVETVDTVRTGRTRAILVPHLFGNPADIGKVVELGNANNIVVIDDAAQALGATIDGQPVGSFGDMGVVSFGAEKICFGLGGGALISHSRGVVDAAREVVLGYPSSRRALAKLASTLIRRSWRGWTLPFQTMFSRGHERSPEAPPARYRQEIMANLNAAVASSLIHALPENLQARRAKVEAYHQLLGNELGIEVIRHGPGSACLSQVVRVLAKQRGGDLPVRIITALNQAGYEVQGSYMPIHLLTHFRQCVWDRLPYTERVWSDLIELPCEPSVTLQDLEQMTALVKSFVAGPKGA
jgi:dTDP-4-amino-4,6-dideoxygalactose transaminase